jgi:hypothetical protein
VISSLQRLQFALRSKLRIQFRLRIPCAPLPLPTATHCIVPIGAVRMRQPRTRAAHTHAHALTHSLTHSVTHSHARTHAHTHCGTEADSVACTAYGTHCRALLHAATPTYSASPPTTRTRTQTCRLEAHREAVSCAVSAAAVRPALARPHSGRAE